MRDEQARTVIVTGAGRGLGREIALAFGRQGNKVLVHYLASETGAGATVEDIRRSGGEAMLFRADMSRRPEADALIEAAIDRWGRIDVLVNNAGRTKDGVMLRMSEDAWDDILAVDLAGPFYAIRAAARHMVRLGEGQVISIASISGVQGREGQANYAAAKAGLIGLTKSVARELGRFNIRVNAVLPGFLGTDMAGTVSERISDRIRAENALGRPNDAAEVARFIHHLSLMRNVSGQVFNLDSRVL